MPTFSQEKLAPQIQLLLGTGQNDLLPKSVYSDKEQKVEVERIRFRAETTGPFTTELRFHAVFSDYDMKVGISSVHFGVSTGSLAESR